MARSILIVMVLFSCGTHARMVEAHVGTGVDLDREGRVYFTDTLHNRIWRLDPDGKLTSLAQGMHLDFLTVGDDGNLYLVDDHAWKLTPQGDLTEVVRATDMPKTIAWAFAVDDQGNIKGPQPRFGRVNAAAAGPDGSIYALDEEQRIRRIKPDGTVSILGNSEEAGYAEGGEERRVRSMGLAVDAENNVYVANYWKRSVFKLSPDGRISTVLISRWPWVPVGVATAASDVYVVERMGNPYGASGLFQFSTLEDRLASPRIRKVSRDGTVTTLAIVKGERSLAVIIVPFSIVILAIFIWRVRKKQLKRRAALGEVRS
jgi:sugar lactone lactonase YvrE